MDRLRSYAASHTLPGRGSRYHAFQVDDSYEGDSADPPPYTPPPVILQTKPTFWSPRKTPPSNHTLWRLKRRRNDTATAPINRDTSDAYSAAVVPEDGTATMSSSTAARTLWSKAVKPRHASHADDDNASDILPLTFSLAGPPPPPYTTTTTSSSNSRSDVISTRNHERHHHHQQQQQGSDRFEMQEIPASSRHAVIYGCAAAAEPSLINNDHDRNKCSIM